MPTGARAAYHAAAHYAGPFVTALLAEAVTIWSRLGIPENDALAALLPLARGDAMTLERHLAALGRFDPALRDFYCRLALRAVPLALAAGKLDAAGAARIRELLETGLAKAT